MRGKTLDQLIEAVRAESRLSTANSRGLENRENVAQVIRRNYELLYGDYDWPHLAIHREDCFVTIQAGQRYYDYPSDIDIETITGVFTNYGDAWVPLAYGVTLATYNVIDSEADQRCDPAQRWQIRDDRQFEVWPIPATNGSLIGFEGRLKFAPLNRGSDRCLIDSSLIELFCAAELLEAVGAKDAQTKRSLASARLLKLRARTSGNGRCIVGGTDPLNSQQSPGGTGLRVVYAR